MTRSPTATAPPPRLARTEMTCRCADPVPRSRRHRDGLRVYCGRCMMLLRLPEEGQP